MGATNPDGTNTGGEGGHTSTDQVTGTAAGGTANGDSGSDGGNGNRFGPGGSGGNGATTATQSFEGGAGVRSHV